MDATQGAHYPNFEKQDGKELKGGNRYMKEQSPNRKNNTELCSINMSDATRQQKIEWLMQIIDNELDRSEEMRDEQLIWECMELLEQYAEKTPAALPCLPLPKDGKVLCTPRKKRLKKIILRLSTAAAVLTMAISLSVYAHAQTLVRRDQQMLTDAMTYAKTVEQEDAVSSGNTIPIQNLTSSEIKQETFTRMTDLFLAYPTLDFQYPRQNSQYPEHLQTNIKHATITYHSDESWVVVLTFDHPSLKSFVIQRQVSSAKYTPPSENPTTIRANYRSYLVSEIVAEEGTVYETGFSNSIGLCYTVQALDIQSLRLALNSIRNMTQTYQAVEEMENDWKHLWGFRLPARMPKGYTLTQISVTCESNAEWRIKFIYQSKDGYQASCYVERKINGQVISGEYQHQDPGLRWIPFSKDANSDDSSSADINIKWIPSS